MTEIQFGLIEVITRLLNKAHEWPPGRTATCCRSIQIEIGASYGLTAWDWKALGRGSVKHFPLRVEATISECTNPSQLAASISQTLVNQSQWARERAR